MNGALVVILVLLWALVLLPGALRSRRSSPTASVGTFERAMDVLARRGEPGRYIYVPRDAGRIVGDRERRRRMVMARRRRTFTQLAIATVVSLPVSIIGGDRWWLSFFVLATALVVNVALLLRWKAQAEQAARVVREMPQTEYLVVGVDEEDALFEDEPMAVGAEHSYGIPVAHHRDEPWTPQTAVRIRRWEE